MVDLVWILAQCAPPGGKGGGGGSFLIQLLPFVLIFVLFYWLVLGPQRKKEKQHRELLNNLKKGDRVVTQGGIYGEIYSLTPDTVVLEIAPKVKVTMRRATIAGLESPPGGAVATAPAKGDERFTKSGKKKKK